MNTFKLLFPATLVLLLFLNTGCKVNYYNSNSRPISHELWDSLVQEYVSSEGLVDYKGFVEDSLRLNRYLELLESHHPNEKNWSDDEQLAYWINAYNAFTVKLIVDHYPVASIKDIKNGIPFVNTVWDIKFIQIEGATYDLNNIEHGIIRPRFDEPRIHFAVNCASISCPKLSNRAYTADKLGQQLTTAAQDFLSDESKNKISQKQVQLSRIFQWYSGDFKKKNDSVIDFINQYAPVQIAPDTSVDYLEYDWSLNEQPAG